MISALKDYPPKLQGLSRYNTTRHQLPNLFAAEKQDSLQGVNTCFIILLLFVRLLYFRGSFVLAFSILLERIKTKTRQSN